MSLASEPLRKKRKSKWGVKPEDLEANACLPSPPTVGILQTGVVQGPKGAEAAAAKLNAMLAAQGKLVKLDPPPCKPVLPSSQSQTSAPPLFSSLGSTTPGAGILSTPQIPTLPILHRPSLPASSSGPYYVQDKVFVGLPKPPSSFGLKERLEGPDSSFLSHISKQMGAKVFLRGKTSGYIEPTSKTESFESLHIYISHPNKQGLESARQLCENLIATVKKDYEVFIASQQLNAPLGFGGSTSHAPPPRAAYVNPYQYPPVPPPQGYGPPPPVPPGYPPPPLTGYPGQPLPLPAMASGYGGYPLPPPHQSSFPVPLPPNPPGGLPPPPQGYYGSIPPTQYLPPQPAQQPPAPDTDDVSDVFSTYKPHDRNPEPMKRKFTEVIESIDESADSDQLELNPMNTIEGKDGDNVCGDSDRQQQLIHNGEALVDHTQHISADRKEADSDSMPGQCVSDPKMTNSDLSHSVEFVIKKQPFSHQDGDSSSKDFPFMIPLVPRTRLASALSTSSTKTPQSSSSTSFSSSFVGSRTGEIMRRGTSSDEEEQSSKDTASGEEEESTPTHPSSTDIASISPHEATVSGYASHPTSNKIPSRLSPISSPSSLLISDASMSTSPAMAKNSVTNSTHGLLASQKKNSALPLVSYSSEDSDDSDSNI